MHRSTRLFVIFSLFLLGACSTTSDSIKNIKNNKLDSIHKAYVAAVQATSKDTKRHWQHGRLGNMTVNLDGGANVGLCYHWQEIVYVGIQSAIDQTGWRAVGIAINEGSFLEHHAVLVYDPQKLHLGQILKPENSIDSYVLDPWKTGQPKLYTLKTWLDMPFSIEKPARLTRIVTFRLTGFQP